MNQKMMKAQQNCIGISTISLLVSLVCLAGLIHVEYKLHINEQHVRTRHDAIITSKNDESNEDLLKEIAKVKEIDQTGK